MDRAQVKRYLLPPIDITRSIISWLKSSGIPPYQIRNNGHWITLTATVAQAESVLGAQYFYWYNGGRQIIRTLEYSVRDDLQDYISMIQPTTRFGEARPQFHSISRQGNLLWPNSTAYNATHCNDVVVPSCLRNLYQLQNFTAVSDDGNLLGISGFLEQYAQYDDWYQFAARYDTSSLSSGRNFSVEYINGGLNTQHERRLDSGEANLDVQYALSLCRGTPVTYYSTGGRGELVPDADQTYRANLTTNEPYLEELHYLLNLPDEKLPRVLTTSYGENEQSVPRPYAENICFLLAQLSARGVSVIFSSGDSGVGQSCQTNDGTNSTRFLPIFPATCPFVTSVGGTTGINPERAVDFSSGGFSDIWSRPVWQEEAVNCYLNKLGSRFEGLYNKHGRGFPDVAAQAVSFAVVDKGKSILLDGTRLVISISCFSSTYQRDHSASAPVFAAVVSNINSVLYSYGKDSLGFLNPLLYGVGRDGFTDILHGGSTGCRGGLAGRSGKRGNFVPNAGFNATEGWDPVTGLGTPLWPKLVGAVLFGMED